MTLVCYLKCLVVAALTGVALAFVLAYAVVAYWFWLFLGR